MRILLLLFLPLGAPDPVFPPSWEGVWKGKCVLDRRQGKNLEFPMELHIRPTKEGWTWQIVYGKQKRPYELKRVKGDHYGVDEKNGIRLDSYDANETLRSRFSVAGNSLEATYARHGDTLRVTITSFAGQPIRTANGVATYELRSVQHGVLKR